MDKQPVKEKQTDALSKAQMRRDFMCLHYDLVLCPQQLLLKHPQYSILKNETGPMVCRDCRRIFAHTQNVKCMICRGECLYYFRKLPPSDDLIFHMEVDVI